VKLPGARILAALRPFGGFLVLLAGAIGVQSRYEDPGDFDLRGELP
jgi:hypothetical protein